MPPMAEESLRELVDGMKQRIQAELEAQIGALTARHDSDLSRAKQDAETEVEKRWASKVEAVRSEWSARLQSEVAAARADAEKRLVSESMRIRTEAEQAVDAERQRAAAELDAERRRGEHELQQTLAALDAERQQQLETDARPPEADVDPTTVLGATRAIADARSLSDVLGSLVRGASAHAPRAALFVVNGTQLDEWSVAGVPPMSRETVSLETKGLLSTAVRRGAMISADARHPERSVPPFAALSPDASAVAMPLMLGGQAVAVLYADEGVAAGERPERSWVESVELLARHAASCLACLTAVRSLQALDSGNANEHTETPEHADDDDRGARRYAKLLISEIKLYNEGAVRVGCEKRDLLYRLREEIARARRLYQERVPASVTGRESYFQHELVHTLAGGDPAALGPGSA
jgi:hypothetical protein